MKISNHELAGAPFCEAHAYGGPMEPSVIALQFLLTAPDPNRRTRKAARAGGAQLLPHLHLAKWGAWQQCSGTISHVVACQVRVDWLIRA